MKILLINNCHFRRGGADVVYLNTGQLLKKNGHIVFHFSQKNTKNIKCDDEIYFANSVNFFETSFLNKAKLIFRFFYAKETAEKLDKLIKDKKPDIAHLHIYKGTLTPSILKVLKINKIPVIQTLHDYGLLCPHNSFIDGKGNICTKCFDSGLTINCVINKCNRNNTVLSILSFLEYNYHRFFFPFHKYIDHFISVCEFSLNMHKSRHTIKNKISRIYNFHPNIENTEVSNKPGDYYLFFGRISSEKGILTLLDAWSNISSVKKLIILGDGPQMSEILTNINDHSTTNVECLGHKNGDELLKFIEQAYFIIVPSEINENNPLSIVESYSLAKPVIASRIGGIPEIVDHNETGFLFKMGDVNDLTEKIRSAEILTEKEYSKFSVNARNFALKNFSEKIHYESLIQTYQNVIKNGDFTKEHK